MIRIKNITKKYHIIECDIFPEDSETAGKLVIDTKDEKILEYSLPKSYEYCENHV